MKHQLHSGSNMLGSDGSHNSNSSTSGEAAEPRGGISQDSSTSGLTSHEMLPQLQHAVNVFPQSCVKCWQLCGPLVGPVNGA